MEPIQNTINPHKAVDKLFWICGMGLLALSLVISNVPLLDKTLQSNLITMSLGILIGIFLSSIYLEKVELETKTKHPYLAQFFGLRLCGEIEFTKDTGKN